jgi:hypothetical protein
MTRCAAIIHQHATSRSLDCRAAQLAREDPGRVEPAGAVRDDPSGTSTLQPGSSSKGRVARGSASVTARRGCRAAPPPPGPRSGRRPAAATRPGSAGRARRRPAQGRRRRWRAGPMAHRPHRRTGAPATGRGKLAIARQPRASPTARSTKMAGRMNGEQGRRLGAQRSLHRLRQGGSDVSGLCATCINARAARSERNT